MCFSPHFATISPNGEERTACILKELEILIGRLLNTAFVIEHPSISTRHARIVPVNNKAKDLAPSTRLRRIIHLPPHDPVVAPVVLEQIPVRHRPATVIKDLRGVPR